MRLRSVMALAAMAAMATVLAACGGGGGSNSTSAAAGAATSTAPADTSAKDYGYGAGTGASSAGGGTNVTVDESEFKLGLSTTTFSPGRYTFSVKDTGHASHNLVIEGPGIEEQKSSLLSPGDSTTLTVTLQKGTYELYCAVANHKSLGMKTEITVR